jgi:Zn-dependent peptidase ImmA (M78 family)
MINLKMPYLKSSDLDAAANELLRRFSKWKGSVPAPPIDVDEIVEGYLRLELEIADLEKRLGIADVLGATWFDEQRICIDQSLEGLEGRFSFTLAHEVGHWVLHRPMYEANKVTRPLFARDPDEARAAEPAIVCRSSQHQAPTEWQANQFAARLLMPGSYMRRAYRVLCGERAQRWAGLRRGQLVDERLRGLAASMIAQGHFDNVSNEAMCRRLVDLRLVVDRAEAA